MKFIKEWPISNHDNFFIDKIYFLILFESGGLGYKHESVHPCHKVRATLTLFHTGSGMTLSHRTGPLWLSLIFCYITQQKVVLTPKICSQIKILIFRHPFTPLFQHSWESVPPFMSVNVNQHLDIECLKIGKTPKGPPFGNEKNFCLRF